MKSHSILILAIRDYLKTVTLSEAKGLAGPNKRFFTALGMTFCILMVLWIDSAADAKYSGGTGEPNDPYQIATAADLNDIGNHQEDCDKHFILINDVNLAEYTGTQFNIIGKEWKSAFTGVFDGNNHKILNFTWSSQDIHAIGLFIYLREAGEIKNLGMENVDVNAATGTCVGGLVGANYGMITNCYSTGRVAGRYHVGGLVGANWSSDRARITNCYSTGSVSGWYNVGGLVGDNVSTITNCYSSGSITEVLWGVGGLVGNNDFGSITHCYSTGSVTGGVLLGGLVGVLKGGQVVASFWDTQTSGQPTSAGGTPKTTAEMKTKSTFTDAGWDFVNIWDICEGTNYPRLR